MACNKADTIQRIESTQHRWIVANVIKAGGSERDEPDQSDRPEEARHACGAV
jgi:hypothetical protein